MAWCHGHARQHMHACTGPLSSTVARLIQPIYMHTLSWSVASSGCHDKMLSLSCCVTIYALSVSGSETWPRYLTSTLTRKLGCSRLWEG